ILKRYRRTRMSRIIARESTMKLMYQMEVNNDFSQDLINLFVNNNELKSDEKSYLYEVINGIKENMDIIDETIEKYSKGWNVNRIAKVDLSILRIAIYEIMFKNDMPYQVSINEAVDVSKKFSTEDSSKFINGLLGAFVKEDKNI